MYPVALGYFDVLKRPEAKVYNTVYNPHVDLLWTGKLIYADFRISVLEWIVFAKLWRVWIFRTDACLCVYLSFAVTLKMRRKPTLSP